MIYLNVKNVGKEDYLLYLDPSRCARTSETYVDYHAVVRYLQTCLSSPSFHIEWCGEPVDESFLFPLVSEDPCELDVWLDDESTTRMWQATVYDLFDCGAVYSDSYATERDAVRHLFVWLIQNDYLPHLPDASIVPDVDTEEEMLERFRQCVEEGTDAMVDDITTVDELFSWCRVLAKGSFARQWTFTIGEHDRQEVSRCRDV